MLQDIEFVPYDDTFLALSRDWLSDPEIKALTMTPDFDRAAQVRWYQSLPGRSDYLIWGVCCGGQPVGVCGLKGIADGTGEYWGYIGEKAFWGRGIGGRMIGFIEEVARSRGLRSVWLRVWDRNAPARRLYEKHGFELDRHESDVVFLTKPLC